MPWIQLKLNTTGANAEELSDALMEAGSVSITFQDTHDTPVFEPLPGETRCGVIPTSLDFSMPRPT